MKTYRITYRNEVFVEANTEEEAQETFEEMDTQEMFALSKYVEQVSIEEVK